MEILSQKQTTLNIILFNPRILDWVLDTEPRACLPSFFLSLLSFLSFFFSFAFAMRFHYEGLVCL